MVTLRGKAAAVVDLNILLGAPGEQRDRRARMIAVRNGGATVCLLVDQIEGLRDVNDADLEPPPGIFADVDVWWLDHVMRCDTADLVGVVNLDRMLSKASLAGTEGISVGV
jgi:chemotaxis signal transduction protein